MFTNPVKERLKAGEPVLNGWLHIPSSLTAEAMAGAGFDTLTLDLQHGPYGLEAVLPMVQAISSTATVPLARVPWNEPGVVMKLLDMGCYGLICPMVSTRAECEAFVGACRYPPAGYRSFGPTRVRLGVGDSYAARANDQILTFAMIETAAALEVALLVAVPAVAAVVAVEDVHARAGIVEIVVPAAAEPARIGRVAVAEIVVAVSVAVVDAGGGGESGGGGEEEGADAGGEAGHGRRTPNGDSLRLCYVQSPDAGVNVRMAIP